MIIELKDDQKDKVKSIMAHIKREARDFDIDGV
jgi:hypothetical protein